MRAAAAAVSAAFLLPAQALSPDLRRIETAYYNGEIATLQIADAPKPVTIGPWRLGERVSTDPKPKDKRLNLYIVAPGRQHHAEGFEQYDNNVIINALPVARARPEFDVYWAIVLDPQLRTDFRHEKDLIIAAQSRFVPGDLYEFQDAPGDGFLREFLKIDSLEGLRKFRNRDGSLPRVVIVPAGFAVRAGATLPAPPDAPAQTPP